MVNVTCECVSVFSVMRESFFGQQSDVRSDRTYDCRTKSGVLSSRTCDFRTMEHVCVCVSVSACACLCVHVRNMF